MNVIEFSFIAKVLLQPGKFRGYQARNVVAFEINRQA